MTKKKLNFEDALARLQKIISEMEQNETPISKSLDLFEEGIELSEFCSNYLKRAEIKVKKLIRKNDAFSKVDMLIEEKE